MHKHGLSTFQHLTQHIPEDIFHFENQAKKETQNMKPTPRRKASVVMHSEIEIQHKAVPTIASFRIISELVFSVIFNKLTLENIEIKQLQKKNK